MDENASIEIAIEELRRRQREQSTTPDSQRKRCPECESMSVSPRNPKWPFEGADERYHCEICGADFDDPVVIGDG